MGFDSAMAALALKKHHGNMSKAVEELCACGGFVTHEENSDSDSGLLLELSSNLSDIFLTDLVFR